jgi:hypothetical protein
MLEFIQTHLYIIYMLLYVVFLVLSCDLSYWAYQQGYVHFKKKKEYRKVKESNIRKEYWLTEYGLWYTLLNFIPLLNVFWYIYLTIHLMKNPYEFSNKYAIQDICNWKKGINAFMWAKWKPTGRWKEKYKTK